MTARHALLTPILAMATVGVISPGVAIALLYTTAVESQQAQLLSTVQRRVRLFQDLLGHEPLDGSPGQNGRPGSSAVLQTVEIYRQFGRFGETGEFLLAEATRAGAVFVVGPRTGEGHQSLGVTSGRMGEPMRRALAGQTGSMVDNDHQGNIHIVAYAPVPGSDWGAVVKVDLAEIRRPFVRAAALAAVAATVAILLSASLFFRPTHILLTRLRHSEANTRALFDTAVDAIITTDEIGIMESANEATARIFDHQAAALVGEDVTLVIPDFDYRRLAETAPAPIDAVRTAAREATGRRRDGKAFPVELSTSVFQTGEQRKIAIIVRDVTERKRGEQELREAHDSIARVNRKLVDHHARLIQTEKLSSIGLLAAGVAHEINNPLAGVKACMKSLASGQVPESRRPEYFSIVREGLDRIQHAVQGLLDFAKERPPRPTRLDASEVVSAACGLALPAARKKGLRIRSEMDKLVLEADRAQILQALLNVLLNAIHASPPGEAIDVTGVDDGDRVGIRVSDRGPGIPAQHLSKICDPFFTTKGVDEGTGLGLAVTLGIVQAHGGALEVESPEQGGAVVTIWMPRWSPGHDREGGDAA